MRRVAWLASLAVVAGCSFGADEYRFVGVTGGSGGAASGAAGVAGGAGLGGAGAGGAGTGGGGSAGAAGKPFCAKGALDCNGKQELVCAADQTKFEPSRKCGPSSTCVPGTGCVLPVEVVAGVETSCARFSDGTVQCWGQNDAGQLGIGSVGAPKANPSKVLDPTGTKPLQKVTSLAVGWKNGCAVSDGAVACWGNDDAGQLGDGTGASPQTPHAKPAMLQTGATRVAGTLLTFCAIDANSKVWCWGSNNAQLAGGSAIVVEAPAVVSGVGAAVDVTVGASVACARVASGGVSCWGLNLRGEAALGMLDNMAHPPGVVKASPGGSSLMPVAQVSAGGALFLGTSLYSHVLAIQAPAQANGSLLCWGWNERGQCLVSGGTASLTTPQAVSAVSPIQVSAGGTHSCATFKSTPTAPNVQCWGWNESGQVGNGLKVASAVKAPFTVPGVVNATVSAGANHTCAIGGEARDTIWCWGDNTFGQIGDGGFDPQPSPKVVQIP